MTREKESPFLWGILGTGGIARQFAGALGKSRHGRLVAVATRGDAVPTAPEFLGARIHHGYQGLLNDPTVQGVYIATPNPTHAEWAVKAAEARKHVLCEKPIGINEREAITIVEAARARDVFLMEAFMYRCHPQTEKLVEIVRSGAIGEVRLIQASFGNAVPVTETSRHHSMALGGGGILDMGCYCVSMSRLIAGVAAGKAFAEPTRVIGSGHLGRTGIDDWAAAILEFPNGLLAQVSTSVTVPLEHVVRIFGTQGRIEVSSPWFCTGRRGGRSTIQVRRPNGEADEIAFETSDWLYEFEADCVARHVAERQAPSPAPSWDDSIGNMRVLDAWRAAVGLRYRFENA